MTFEPIQPYGPRFQKFQGHNDDDFDARIWIGSAREYILDQMERGIAAGKMPVAMIVGYATPCVHTPQHRDGIDRWCLFDAQTRPYMDRLLTSMENTLDGIDDAP